MCLAVKPEKEVGRSIWLGFRYDPIPLIPMSGGSDAVSSINSRVNSNLQFTIEESLWVSKSERSSIYHDQVSCTVP